MNKNPELLELAQDESIDLVRRAEHATAWLDKNLRLDRVGVKKLLDQLLPLVEAAGLRNEAAWLRFYLGWYYLDGDDFKTGLSVIETARDSFEALGDVVGGSRTSNALGFLYSMLGVFDLALDFYRMATERADQAGKPEMAGTALMNTAECLYELDEPEAALLAIERCRSDYSIAPYNITHAHHVAGLVYGRLGKLAESEKELRQAILTAKDTFTTGLDSRRVLAELLLDTGRLEEAARYIDEGLAQCLANEDRLIGIRFRLALSRLHFLQEHLDEALAEARLACTLAQELGVKKVEADAEKAAYEAWQKKGDCGEALAAFVRYTSLKDTIKGEQTSKRILGLHEDRIRREARYYESLYRQISSIGEIGQRITANLDLNVTLESIYEAVNGLLDAPTLVIALLNNAGDALDYRLIMLRGERQEPFSVPLTESSFGAWCLSNNKDILIGDVQNEYQQYFGRQPLNVISENPEKSLVYVPLRVGERVAGVFSVQSEKLQAYDKRSLETIKAIGSYLGIAVENSRLFGQIQRLATVDALTGLLNRRAISELLAEEFQKSARYKRSLSVMMVDIDFFKAVNDTYGHDGGDFVLKAVGAILKGDVRSCDFAGRFGGEEFVLVLPETGLEGGLRLAERLRRALEATEIPLGEGSSCRVTASFGLSALCSEDDSYESLLKRADLALYQSKDKGRNCVSHLDGSPDVLKAARPDNAAQDK